MTKKVDFIIKTEDVQGFLPPDHHDVIAKKIIDATVSNEFTVSMSIFNPGGRSDQHAHVWQHAFYVIRGRGRARVGDKEHDITADTAIFVPSNIPHSIENTGTEQLVILSVSGQRK